MNSKNHQRTLKYACWILTLSTAAMAAETPVALGSAANFVALAGSTVTNVSSAGTVITGNIGVSPGTAVTGFPPGIVTGAIHAGDAAAAQAQLDLTTAYNDAAGRSTSPTTVSGNIGGMTLAPGLYKSTSSLAISSGDLTLDGQGDSNAVFIFQMASTLTTTSGRQVILTGGAQAANVFWQVGSSATLGTTTNFKGNILANVSISLNTGATLDGRALARSGSVSLDSNAVTEPVLVIPTATPTPTPTVTPTATPFTPTPTPCCHTCESFEFTYSDQGWTSHSLDVFTAPLFDYNPFTPGTLDITATDNVANFGYWESPVFEIVPTEGTATRADSIPLGVSRIDGTSVFAIEYKLRGDAPTQDVVPEIRLRATAENSQQSDLAVISSNSEGGISPYKGNPTTATVFFKPASGSPDFRLQFDMLNFAPLGDSGTATVALDSVSICKISTFDLADATQEAHFTFNSSDDGWNGTIVPGFRAPGFSRGSVNGSGSLQLTALPSEGNFEFGYWGSSETGTLVRPVDGRLYFAEFTVNSDQTDASIVPSFRVRINESGFRVAQYLQVASTGSSFNSPTVGNAKTYTVFFPPNVGTDGAYLIYSFDIVTQDSDGDSTSAVLSLTDVNVRSIALP